MSFWGDDRSQSVQVGAILLFGFVIIGMSTYQATVVPSQNEEIEFGHEQTVRSDMIQVRNSVVSTGTTGETAPTEVKLGTRFPSRTLFINPPPAVGELKTGPPRNVTVNFTRATFNSPYPGETDDFWVNESGDLPARDGNYSTRAIQYRSNYRVYDGGAANVTVELGHAYAGYENGRTVNLTSSPVFVSGERVTVFLVKGEYRKAGVDTVSVDPDAISTVQRRERVENFSVVVPTRLEPGAVRSLLDQQYGSSTSVGTLGGSADVKVGPATESDRVNVTFTNRTYAFAVAAVELDEDGDDDADVSTEASSLDPVSVEKSVQKGSTARVELEVRDQFGNQNTSAVVQANSTTGSWVGGSGTTLNETVDGDGRVAFEFDTRLGNVSAGTEYALNFTLNRSLSPGVVGDASFDNTTGENVTVRVSVTSAPGPAPGPGPGPAPGPGAWPLWWTNPSTDAEIATAQSSSLSFGSCSNTTCFVDAGGTADPLLLKVTTAGETDGASVNYAVNDTSVATLNESSDQTAPDGNDTVALLPAANGTVRVSVTSGGATREIDVTFDGVSPSAAGTLVFAQGDKLKYSEGTGEPVESYGTGNKVDVFGPSLFNIVGGSTVDTPYVKNGKLFSINKSGSNTKLVNNVKEKPIGVGDFDGDGKASVYYETNGGKIGEFERGDSNGEQFKPSNDGPYKTSGIAGVGDVDNDGNAELVYTGSSQGIKYIDDDGTAVSTGKGAGSNGGTVGIGAPVDFNGDGYARVPYVTGSANVRLLYLHNGSMSNKKITGVSKAPLASVDVTGDGTPDIVAVDSGVVLYYDLVNDIQQPFNDDTGSQVSADSQGGVR